MAVDQAIIAWFVRIIESVAIIIVALVINREVQNRDQSENTSNKLEKWLNVLSLFTMISFLISVASILFSKVSTICEYTYPLQGAFWIISMSFMSLYQIARLQHCFSVEQIHSTHYALPNYLFMFMYTVGIIIIPYHFVTSVFR